MTDDLDDEQEPTAAGWPQTLYAIRRRTAAPSLASCVVELATKAPAILHTGPFEWDVASDPPQRVQLTEAVVEQLMGEALMLADKPTDWTTVIGASAPFAPPGMRALDILDVGLPGPREAQLADLAGMMTLVGAAGTALHAHVAFTQDAALAHTYHGRRAMLRNHAAVAKLVPGYVPNEQFEPIAGVASGLPELLEAIEIDDTLAPDGVYWINWWSAKIVDAIGRERVLNAGWARTEQHADGSLTLAATDAPPDLTSPRDVARLAGIIRTLDLLAHQTKHAVVP